MGSERLAGTGRASRVSFLCGVFLASLSTLSLEILLTRIFSVTMYYHFAFMVVSLALLGLGVSGIAVYLAPWIVRRAPGTAAAISMMLFTGAALLALHVALTSPVSLWDWDLNKARLPWIYAAACLPFLASGMALSTAIAAAGDRIGRVYAADLAGAATGAVLVILVLPSLGGPGAVIAAGAAGALSAVMFSLSDAPRPRALRGSVAGIALVAAVSVGWIGATEKDARRFGFACNPEKFLGTVRPVFERWNAISQVTVASLGDRDHRWIFIDGGAATRMWGGTSHEFDWNTIRRIPEIRVASLAYTINGKGPALIIGPGGGTDVMSALSLGVPRVVGVELNPIIVNDVMKGEYADWSNRLYFDDRVRIVVDEGRSWVRRSDEEYSSIQATLVDTWAASAAGAFTLSENNLYTVEAFEDFLDHLAPDGLLTMTRWYDAGQPREMLRLIALGREALERRGVEPAEAGLHFVIACDPDRRASMILGRKPFSPELVASIARRAAREGITLLYVPHPVTGTLAPVTGGGNSSGEDPVLAGFLRSADAASFLDGLPYDASPTTDDRPFFFCNLRGAEMLSLIRDPARANLNNLGILLLLMVLAVSAALTLLFILAPLLLFRRSVLRVSGLAKARVLGYFLAIGFGFILVEIGFMQKFVLFLGHPFYALAVVLASLLLASGLGSALLSGAGVSRWGVRGLVRRTAPALAAVLAAYAVMLGPLFRALVGLPLGARIPVAAILVALPGLLMGTMLPSGVRAANAIDREMVPWAWGLNGAASVVGSVLAFVISLNYGFTASLFAGIAVYLLAMVAMPFCRQEGPSVTGGQSPGGQGLSGGP